MSQHNLQNVNSNVILWKHLMKTVCSSAVIFTFYLQTQLFFSTKTNYLLTTPHVKAFKIICPPSKDWQRDIVAGLFRRSCSFLGFELYLWRRAGLCVISVCPNHLTLWSSRLVARGNKKHIYISFASENLGLWCFMYVDDKGKSLNAFVRPCIYIYSSMFCRK